MAAGGLFLPHCHPSTSPSSACLSCKMKCWSVWEIWHPHIFLWICHFTYRRLTSQYRHNEPVNGDIIPVRFRGGTVITHLSICRRQRIECDCVSEHEQASPHVCVCVRTWCITLSMCVFQGCASYFRSNVTAGALSPRIELKCWNHLSSNPEKFQSMVSSLFLKSFHSLVRGNWWNKILVEMARRHKCSSNNRRVLKVLRMKWLVKLASWTTKINVCRVDVIVMPLADMMTNLFRSKND